MTEIISKEDLIRELTEKRMVLPIGQRHFEHLKKTYDKLFEQRLISLHTYNFYVDALERKVLSDQMILAFSQALDKEMNDSYYKEEDSI